MSDLGGCSLAGGLKGRPGAFWTTLGGPSRRRYVGGRGAPDSASRRCGARLRCKIVDCAALAARWGPEVGPAGRTGGRVRRVSQEHRAHHR